MAKEPLPPPPSPQALLSKNLDAANVNIEANRKDLGVLREQVTTTEVRGGALFLGLGWGEITGNYTGN